MTMRTGYVMWPEGNPKKARWLPVFTVGGLFKDWLFAFGWSLTGKRTCRVRPVDEDGDPVACARNCERVAGR